MELGWSFFFEGTKFSRGRLNSIIWNENSKKGERDFYQ